MAVLILPVYIALLLVGGLMGYLKAGSKVSLITSIAFAIALAVFGYAPVPYGPQIVLGLLVLLLVVFLMRYVKTRKFMPAGMMVLLTALAGILLWLTIPGAGTP